MNTNIINRSEVHHQWSKTLTKRLGKEIKVRTSRLITNCGITADWVTTMTNDLFPALSNRAIKPTRQAMQAALLNIATGVSESLTHGQPSGFICGLSTASRKIPKRYRDHDFSSNTMASVLSQLESAGFLESYKGFRSENYSKGLATLWLPTARATDYISKLNDMIAIEFFCEDIETLRLKGSNGSLIDYEDNNMTNEMRLNLKEVNDLRASVNWFYKPQRLMITHPNGELLAISRKDLTLKRQFNETFNRGGRFYGNVQQLTKNERSTIIMGGEPTIELDIKSLHPRMLYNLKGIPAPVDCYDVKGYDRETMKAVALTALNAESELSATRGLSKNKMTFDHARRAIEAFRLRHRPIAEFLFTSIWGPLQYQDSELAKDILSEAANHGIPVIPVHDSFISSVSNGYKLSEIMHEEYEKRFGFMPEIEPSLSCLSAGIAA